jgi:hypothetical protein
MKITIELTNLSFEIPDDVVSKVIKAILTPTERVVEDAPKVETTLMKKSPKLIGVPTRQEEEAKKKELQRQKSKEQNQRHIKKQAKLYPYTEYQRTISKFIASLLPNQIFKTKQLHEYIASQNVEKDSDLMSFYIAIEAEMSPPRNRIERVKHGYYKRK